MMQSSSRPSAMTGLTLVELMIGVAILGIILALAAPSFTGFIARAKVRGAANEVYADMQFARSESVQRNRVVQVVVGSTDYRIELRNASNTGWETLKTVTWASAGVSLTSDSSTMQSVVFNPVRATAVTTPSGGSVKLSHASVSGAAQVSVSVTGRAELCSPSGTIGGMPSC